MHADSGQMIKVKHNGLKDAQNRILLWMKSDISDLVLQHMSSTVCGSCTARSYLTRCITHIQYELL